MYVEFNYIVEKTPLLESITDTSVLVKCFAIAIYEFDDEYIHDFLNRNIHKTSDIYEKVFKSIEYIRDICDLKPLTGYLTCGYINTITVTRFKTFNVFKVLISYDAWVPPFNLKLVYMREV